MQSVRQHPCRAVVKRDTGFVAGGFDAEDQQNVADGARAWQKRRKSLLYWAFCRYSVQKARIKQHKAAQLQTLNPQVSEIGWA